MSIEWFECLWGGHTPIQMYSSGFPEIFCSHCKGWLCSGKLDEKLQEHSTNGIMDLTKEA